MKNFEQFVTETMDIGAYGEYVNFNSFLWPTLLDYAKKYGWDPAGTILPIYDEETYEPTGEFDDDWDGSYSTNDSQQIQDEDAAELADALSRLLDDIPDEPTTPLNSVNRQMKSVSNPSNWQETLFGRDTMSGIDQLADVKDDIKKFINILRTVDDITIS